MEYTTSIIPTLVDYAGILVMVITAVATIVMVNIMKRDINPSIAKIQKSVGTTLERAKKELIYKRYFPEYDISETEFDEAVLMAYRDIMLLMPIVR